MSQYLEDGPLDGKPSSAGSDQASTKKIEPYSNPFDPLQLLKSGRDLLSGPPESKNRAPSTNSTLEIPPLKQAESNAIKQVTEKVISNIKDSADPANEIRAALERLNDINDATITRHNGSSHVDIKLARAQTMAPPNLQVRGFTPVASHLGCQLSFDITPAESGVLIHNMHGFSSSVRGPLGRIRHSETNSMFLSKDSAGQPFLMADSELHMRRRTHASSSIIREGNLPADSPMRSLLTHPEALDNLGSAMRLFQSKDDLIQLSLKRDSDKLNVRAVAKDSKHVGDLNQPINPAGAILKSIDIDKVLSAEISQDKTSVKLAIQGLKVNVEMGPLKFALTPTKIELEKDKVKLELKNPKDGSILPVAIPIERLREAARR
jgi:hypothetical protein